MEYTMFYTDFLGVNQRLWFNAKGYKYVIGITDNESDEGDGAFSSDFASYDEAIQAYMGLIRDFGGGDYSWVDRMDMVRKLGK